VIVLSQLRLHGFPLRQAFALGLLLILFNVGYWGLRVWGHGLWIVYLSLAGLVWWRYPQRSVRMRIIILIVLQTCFERLPVWLPPAYGGGDGGYTTSLFLYWPLSIRSVFIATDHGWERVAVIYTVWAIIGSLVILPVITYFRGRRFYCTMLCRWALISETLGEPFRSRAPKGRWAQYLENTPTALLGIVVVLTLLMALGLNIRVGSSSLSQWYQLILINYLTFIVSVGIIPILGARARCRYICPMGAYLRFFQTHGRFRLVADASACISCSRCDETCDMGIGIMRSARTGGLLNSGQCTGCGLCVAVCPTSVLSFSYSGDLPPEKVAYQFDKGRIRHEHATR
jgi:Fe-S-cluster-containing hydrogenase component 2|tara:strand:+ start:18804 stop:19832 length:1029 start_codon:yes stop_codon:yes gene_type:complete